MYNSIYPININYSNQYRKKSDSNSPSQNATENNSKQDTFPNGQKVSIDYTKGQINISQVLADFRNTIIAINAPKEIQEEVATYLNLVEKESKKDTPSREIVLSNLKNASRISDEYITKSLNKPSKVVEGWIDALFLQKINLKSDPDEINPDFLLEFPQNAQQRIENTKAQEEAVQPQTSAQEIKLEDVPSKQEVLNEKELLVEPPENPQIETLTAQEELPVEIENSIELSSAIEQPAQKTQTNSEFNPNDSYDTQAKEILTQIKTLPQTNEGDTQALNMLNDALGILEHSTNANKNIKAAIHFERAKIFDDYDYVDYALRDYFEATKATELNLKAQAFFKSGSIYDEFNEFEPALDGYLSSVAYSGEADNARAQALVLSKIESLYTKQYDTAKTQEYAQLALDCADSTQNQELIAKTYSKSAQNLQYLGEHEKALSKYKNAIKAFLNGTEEYDDMAYNYEQAAIVMRKLGNHAKANKLQAKAQLYRQKAQPQEEHLAIAS